MIKMKFLSEDSRTGFPEGSVVELSSGELDALPFNVKMKLLDSISDSERLAREAEAAEKERLASFLEEKGLSPGRVRKVLEKHASLEALRGALDSPGVDDLTDEWLKKALAGGSSSDVSRSVGKGAGAGGGAGLEKLAHEDRRPASASRLSKKKKDEVSG